LHRHRDGNDYLAPIVDPHHASVSAVKRLRDFLIALSVLRTEFIVERKVAAPEPAAQRNECALHQTWFVGARRRKVETQYVAAAVKISAVKNEDTVAIVDARSGLGWRHEPAQHRRDALRIDREFDAGKGFIGRPVALAGLQLEKALRIDRDGVRLDGGRRGDCAGNNFALRKQALHARVNQPGAELRQIKNASD